MDAKYLLNTPGPCERPFFHLEDRCLYIEEKKVAWAEARDTCRSLGSELVKIDSEAFQLALSDYLYSLGKLRKPLN